MPWVTINQLTGHGDKAVCGTLAIPLAWVKTQLVEMQPADHSIGGVTLEKLK